MAMTSVMTQCAYQGEADLDAIASLINLCNAVDQLDRGTSVPELREDYADPDFDPANDLKLWRDDAGRLLATASFWRSQIEGRFNGYLNFCVHPDARQGPLAAQILTWAEQYCRTCAQAAPLPGELQISMRETETTRIALCQQQGYSLIREFYRMARSLADPIPRSVLPDGYRIRQVDCEGDGEAWVDMFNQSFIDHWNHEPMTLKQYRYYTSMVEYEPQLDQVVVSPDGTLTAFCYCKIHSRDNQRKGSQEGWINVLGTRRGYRKQGLGRAILQSGLHQLKQAGMETALLGVDSMNPSGALKLYQSVGFQQQHTSCVYQKRVYHPPNP